LFFAPGKLPAGTVAAAVSQLDIAPTVLGLLGLLGFAYTAPFYGQNVLSPASAGHPILMNHNHDVAFIENDAMVVLGLQRSQDFYRYEARTDRLAANPEDPALVDRATAYYQTAFELFKSHRYE
jgi:phosphoglycerol transferase MdoB-like AlkP superfamily enzyme